MRRFFKYFQGISFEKRRIHVATTGAVIEIDRSFRADLIAVVKIYTYFVAQKIKQIFTRPKLAGTIAFYPQIPGPWYNIWQVVRLAGLKTLSDVSQANYVFIFEDKTFSQYDKDFVRGPDAVQINHRVDDISKDHVAGVFEDVFGYAIRIDPMTHTGPAIRKSNVNGTHDGIVIDCPIDVSELSVDHTYQRLVDSTFNGKTSEDLRIAYVLGKIALVYHKHKPLDDRFGTDYLSVDVKTASDVFSPKEVRLISLFCEKMGLDFGAVDVMRDKHDDRIYIVDVNKTCMPVLSLSLKTQIKSQQKIADGLIQGLP